VKNKAPPEKQQMLGILMDLADLRVPPEWYPEARKIKRYAYF